METVYILNAVVVNREGALGGVRNDNIAHKESVCAAERTRSSSRQAGRQAGQQEERSSSGRVKAFSAVNRQCRMSDKETVREIALCLAV